MQSANCLNCGETLHQEYNYCPSCSQSATIHRLNAHHFLHELVHFFTHADKGIFLLVKELATKPGKPAAAYIAGQRKKYMSPLSFFLIVTGLFVFTSGVFKTFEPPKEFEKIKLAIKKLPPAVQHRIMAKMGRAEYSMHFVGKYSNIIQMIGTPVIALIFFLFYFRNRYNYWEHLVANLYLAGYLGLITIIIVNLAAHQVDNQVESARLVKIYLVFDSLFRAVYYYQFMDLKSRWNMLRALAAGFATVYLWFYGMVWLLEYYVEHGF